MRLEFRTERSASSTQEPRTAAPAARGGTTDLESQLAGEALRTEIQI